MLNIPDPISAYDDYMDKLDRQDALEELAQEKSHEVMQMKVEDFVILSGRVGHDDTVAMVLNLVCEYLAEKEMDDD